LATQGEKTLKVSPTIVENGVLNVIFDVYTEGSSFSIVNLMGQQIMSGKTANSIDVSDLPQGVFILKMGALQAKFIKQ
jgi:predicted type IV restriction endonuclease